MVDIPKWHQFMKPLLEVLKENGEMYRHDAIEAVVRKENLTGEQLALVQESNGKSKAKGRVGWASSYLRVAGALSGPRRGYFALGPNAETLLNLVIFKTTPGSYQIQEVLGTKSSLHVSRGCLGGRQPLVGV